LNILIAEDEPDISTMYFKILNERGHTVIIIKNGEEFLIQYNEELQKVRGITNARENTFNLKIKARS
jgi:DNA-binding response OmpR family regulator